MTTQQFEVGNYHGLHGTTPAIKVVQATKSFLDLTVEKGTIYGLLGPSGCGKTTLISCLVGLQKLNCGRIEIMGRNIETYENGIPGGLLGYMPQELALYNSFTILETFNYYGFLHGMTQKNISMKLDKFQKLLNLPGLGKYVNQISGGEQRRVSLGVALLHDPQLLIMDEPTTGC
ncbi:ABC transporter G family member 23 [Folsomia candida]|uniref:ABC transporter G family member 23 n=1 Tax=Folsomia candida TaxID=158441 RepID=A0A226ESJ3_FOLCA|nr:ABC transporter G family member 23 [Folsomia candida]